MNIELLKPSQVCEFLCICRKTLTRYENRGLIKAIKFNSRVFRYDPDDVSEMVEKHKKGAA